MAIINSDEFMIVTNAITNRRVLINKMAVAKVEEPHPDAGIKATSIYLDPDMVIPAAESFDDISEAFITEDEEYYEDI